MNASSPNPAQDPEITATTEAVLHALLELQCFSTTHAVDDELGKNFEALVAAGAVSSHTASFFKDHQGRFYGFQVAPTRPDIPVLDVLLANRTTPIRCVGFRNGQVELKEATA